MTSDLRPKSKLRRRLGWGLGVIGATGVVAWVLVHSTSWAGPLFANTLRSVVGTDNVARLEDFVYAIDDRIARIRRRGEKPKAYWEIPATKPKLEHHVDAGSEPDSATRWRPFELKSVGPVHKGWSAPGDGQWVAVDDPRHTEAPTAMYKTLVHPDPNRSWGELFVIAIDLEQTDLHAVAGTHEPKAEAPVPKDFARPGKIPAADHEFLLAAFNGGFMAEHGHYGMLVNDVTLIKPRDTSCTVVGYRDGSVEIATWKSVGHAQERMQWFRQTPACMYENGTMHVGLRYPETRQWGATLDGDTVIRRSAIGLDESRRVLFVGIGNNMTARALGEGMHHAGAFDVAQLDVNWSYPKFLIYGQGNEGNLEAKALMDGFEYTAGEYVTKPALRDFFYLTRRKAPRDNATPAQSTERPAAPDAGAPDATRPDATKSDAVESGAPKHDDAGVPAVAPSTRATTPGASTTLPGANPTTALSSSATAPGTRATAPGTRATTPGANSAALSTRATTPGTNSAALSTRADPAAPGADPAVPTRAKPRVSLTTNKDSSLHAPAPATASSAIR